MKNATSVPKTLMLPELLADPTASFPDSLMELLMLESSAMTATLSTAMAALPLDNGNVEMAEETETKSATMALKTHSDPTLADLKVSDSVPETSAVPIPFAVMVSLMTVNNATRVL